jgi:hypothetical protein
MGPNAPRRAGAWSEVGVTELTLPKVEKSKRHTIKIA